jgi:hypothetical protein
MKKFISILIFFLVIREILCGQVMVVNDANLRNPEIMIMRKTSLTYAQIEGKPYLTDSFELSRVYLKDKSSLEMKLRYDIYSDEMEIRNKTQAYYLVKPRIDSILLKDIKFVYTEYAGNSKNAMAYFIVLTEGKNTLLLKKRVEFIDQDKAKPYADTRPARFETKADLYYFKRGKDPAVQLSSLKSFRKDFPELYITSQSFIQTEEISFKKQDDLIRLVKYLNSNE